MAFLLERVRETAGRLEDRDAKLHSICKILADGLTTYDWVGFYLVDEAADELVLGPYFGAPTEHVRIPFGRGVCGQAAERRETIVVDDVGAEPNYLACSPAVRSEIVVPMFKGGRLIGQLDVDSRTPAAFEAADRTFLEEVVAVAAML